MFTLSTSATTAVRAAAPTKTARRAHTKSAVVCRASAAESSRREAMSLFAVRLLGDAIATPIIAIPMMMMMMNE
jgi:hypothetical protein